MAWRTDNMKVQSILCQRQIRSGIDLLHQGVQMMITVLTCVCLLGSSGFVQAGDVNPRQELYTPNYKIYHNVSYIGEHLKHIASKFPNYIRLDEAYVSRNKIPQYLVQVTNFTNYPPSGSFRTSDTKAKVLLSFGEHAREFFPVESAFHLLHNITNGLYSPKDSQSRAFTKRVLSRLDLYIIVLANPDGRLHIEKTKNYCWRGTSVGVDLDRNFDWNFGGPGSKADPNDEEYRGPYPHSEPECLVYLDLTSRHHFDAFVSFHSGIKEIYVPFADSKSKDSKVVPDNIADQLQLAKRMAKSTHQSFTYGIGYNLNNYPADGTIYDYMSGVRQIPNSLAIEMWGVGDQDGAQCFDLFNPPNEQLHIAVKEVMPLYETFFDNIIRWKENEVHKYFHEIEEPEFGLSFGYLLLFLTFALFLLLLFQHKLPYSLRPYPRKRVVSLRSLSSTFTTLGGIKMT